MIGGVIKHFEQDSDDIFAASMYALGICICAVIPTIVHHPFVMAVLQSGMRMRVACCALVYKKVHPFDLYLLMFNFIHFPTEAFIKIIIS